MRGQELNGDDGEKVHPEIPCEVLRASELNKENLEYGQISSRVLKIQHPTY